MNCAILILALAHASPSAEFELGTRLVADPCHPGEWVYLKNQVRIEASPVAIVSADSLRDLGIASIEDILVRENYPAVQVNTPTTLLGLNPQRTDLDLAEIEKIEVLRDGAGSMYGSDAIAAVVNVVLKSGGSNFGGPLNTVYDEQWFNPNEHIQPDGWTNIRLRYEPVDLFADTKVYLDTTLEGHTETTSELLGQHNIFLASYLRPLQPEINFYSDMGQFGGLSDTYYEGVGGIKFNDEYAAKLNTPSIWLPRPKFDLQAGFDYSREPLTSTSEYIQDSIRAFGQSTVQNWMSNSGLSLNAIQNYMQGAAATGTDMNRLYFPGDPAKLADAKCGSEMAMPAGTLWLPDRSGYQATSNISPFKFNFTFAASGALLASNGGQTPLAQQDFRIHCVSMALKEPGEGVRYYPYSSPDPIWTTLAKRSGEAMIRGPWDQARTWIYTDKATIDEINKRVMLGVTPSQYVNGLYEIATLGGLRSRDYKNGGMWNSKLLASPTAKDSAFAWFATSLALNHGKAVHDYLRGQPAEVAALLAPNAKPEEKLHATRLFANLLTSPEGQARKGALLFLEQTTTGLDALDGHVGGLRMSLYSKDRQEVELALKLLEKLPGVRPEVPLLYLANHGASQDIKDKAKALLPG